MSKKFLWSMFLVLSLSSDLKPLSKTKVITYSTVVGVASGVAVGYGVNKLLKGKNNRKTVASGAALASGLMVGFLMRDLLSSPEDIYDNSINYISEINFIISEDFILSRNTIDKKELVDHINARWGGSWPLVGANDYLVFIRSMILSLSRNLVKAEKELKKSKNNEELLNKCVALNSIFIEYSVLLKDRISIIISDENYNVQKDRYREYIGDKMKSDSAAWQGFWGSVLIAGSRH